jgi:ubiquinone/menaquinone biosynthesis C-methylase UbiE
MILKIVWSHQGENWQVRSEMKVGKLEKWFMTRQQHGERVVERAENLLSFINLEEGQDYLEIGCGGGAVCRHVATKYGLKVTGIDIDPEMLEAARSIPCTSSSISFQRADVTTLPFPDNSFDIVLSFGAMHHIPNWLDAMREIRRVLEPKGYLVLWDLFYNSVTARLAELFEDKFGATTQQALEDFVQENELDVIHCNVRNALLWYSLEAVYRSK